MHSLRRIPLEAWIWTAGLVAVALADPASGGLFDLCLWRAVLDVRCPGCGLGHAVGLLVRGEWVLAWQTHPLAPAAVLVLAGRVVHLVRTAPPSSSPSA